MKIRGTLRVSHRDIAQAPRTPPVTVSIWVNMMGDHRNLTYETRNDWHPTQVAGVVRVFDAAGTQPRLVAGTEGRGALGSRLQIEVFP